jgi:hypothetical protein
VNNETHGRNINTIIQVNTKADILIVTGVDFRGQCKRELTGNILASGKRQLDLLLFCIVNRRQEQQKGANQQ